MTAVLGRDAVGRFASVLATLGVVIAVVGLTVGVIVPGASGPFSGAESDATATGEGPTHVDPTTIEGEAELGNVEQRLLNDFAQQVESGAINLTEEDYDQARDQLGDDRVDDLLDEYQGMSDGESEVQLLRNSQQALENYTDAVAAYWELHAVYEQLTDSNSGIVVGDEAVPSAEQNRSHTARRVATQLDTRAERVTEQAGVTAERYRALENGSDREYTATITAIEASQTNVTATQQTVLREQFSLANLTLAVSESQRISPQQPLETRGRLVVENGTALSNQTVTLTVGTQTKRITTNGTGWFDLQYRPTALLANTTALTVAVTPSENGSWVGDEQSLDVTVEQIQPTLRAAPTTTTVSFNETFAVTGSLFVQHHPIGNVSYRILVDGRVVAEDATTADGLVNTSLRLPATVEPGEHEVRVELRTEGQALAPVNETATVNVSTTPTNLTFAVETIDDETIRVTGQLTADDGVGLGGQLVQVQIADTTVDTIRTDTAGRFNRTVVMPRTEFDEQNASSAIPVRLVFDGRGTSLESTDQQGQLTGFTKSLINGRSGTGLSVTRILVPGAGVVLVVCVGYLAVWWLRRSPDSEVVSDGVSSGPDTPVSTTTAESESLMTRAIEYSDSDSPAEAIQNGYAAIRAVLTDDEATQQMTHWEFYQHYRDTLDDDTEALLRRATEHYERVVFAAESPDNSMVDDVVAALDALAPELADEIDDESDRSTSPADD